MTFSPGVHLSRTDENVTEIEALASRLGGAAGLDTLLGDLKYRARRWRAPRLLGRAVHSAVRWDAYDCADPRWWPQGITTSADASDTEDVAGRRVLATTWYSKKLDGANHGSRVTFLDLETLRYRHVLLVVPALDDEGRLRLEPLRVHAGGLVWAGPYLHVAATARGFVTCRLEDLMRVEGDNERPDAFGVDGERVHSYGHHYVLPVRFRYDAHADDGHEKLRYSFLSLDRASDPPSLLAGEYAYGSEKTRRLARFSLDPETLLLATGDDGSSRPVALDDGVAQMQGAVAARGRLHVTASRGPWMPGSVFTGSPGDLREHRFATPMGCEDIAYWPSTDLLWSVTEHPRRRWIYSMRRSWFD